MLAIEDRRIGLQGHAHVETVPKNRGDERPLIGLAGLLFYDGGQGNELASREQRADDVERILYELVEQHGSDARVAQLWVQEAVRRGWYREAEDGVDALTDALPSSRTIVQLRLATLGVLDRLEERRELVRELLGEGVASLRLVEEFTSSCLVDDGAEAVERLRSRFDDPSLDVALIQFYLSRGDARSARGELDAATQLDPRVQGTLSTKGSF